MGALEWGWVRYMPTFSVPVEDSDVETRKQAVSQHAGWGALYHHYIHTLRAGYPTYNNSAPTFISKTQSFEREVVVAPAHPFNSEK